MKWSEWVTVANAVTLVGDVSERTLRLWIQAEWLPTYRFRRLVCVRVEDVREVRDRARALAGTVTA